MVQLSLLGLITLCFARFPLVINILTNIFESFKRGTYVPLFVADGLPDLQLAVQDCLPFTSMN